MRMLIQNCFKQNFKIENLELNKNLCRNRLYISFILSNFAIDQYSGACGYAAAVARKYN